MHNRAIGAVWHAALITLAGIAVFLAFAVTQLPRGYSNDLSRIGKGSNVTVLVHDKGAVQSLELMALLDSIRADYADAIEFLIVDIASEQGRGFSREHHVGAVALAFFGPHGEHLGVRYDIRDEAGLREALKQAFRPGN